MPNSVASNDSKNPCGHCSIVLVVLMMGSGGGATTIKTLGQFGGTGTKSMGGPFYSTHYKCELGLYIIECSPKEVKGSIIY